MSSGAWQNSEGKADFTSHHALHKEASVSKLWIYRKDKKKWYTPEEFKTEYIDQDPAENMKSIIGSFCIMNPQVGLRQRLDFMRQTSEEIELFTKRVVDYYSKPNKR
jgi:hypothetical protein